MEYVFYIEIALVFGVILLQFFSGIRTFGAIRRLKKLMPLKIIYELQEISTKNENEIAINRILLLEEASAGFTGIIEALNRYLYRNKAAASDFHLIKDLVERTTDTEEENIQQNITLPLYLGLMGTMGGIVFGLLQMFLVSNNADEVDISGFLQGVALAMFASLIGLAITVFNSSWAFKGAKAQIERSKNLFYNFIQTELLPVVNQNVMSNVQNLNKTLSRFNTDFTTNLKKLDTLFTRNYEALKVQDKVLTALNELDITTFAQANITILQELKISTEKLGQFNSYLDDLTYLSDSTTRLSSEFKSLMQGSNYFKDIAQKLEERVDENNHMLQFFNANYEQLLKEGNVVDEMAEKITSEMLNAMNRMSDNIPRALEGYREHLDQKVETIKRLANTEADLMTRSYSKQEKYLEKLELLGELRGLVQELTDMSKENKSVFVNGFKLTELAVKDIGSEILNNQKSAKSNKSLKHTETATIKPKHQSQKDNIKRKNKVNFLKNFGVSFNVLKQIFKRKDKKA